MQLTFKVSYFKIEPQTILEIKSPPFRHSANQEEEQGRAPIRRPMTRRDTFSQPERSSQHGCGGAVNAQKSVCVREEAQFYGNINDDPSIKKGRFVDLFRSCTCLVVFSDLFLV